LWYQGRILHLTARPRRRSAQALSPSGKVPSNVLASLPGLGADRGQYQPVHTRGLCRHWPRSDGHRLIIWLFMNFHRRRDEGRHVWCHGCRPVSSQTPSLPPGLWCFPNPYTRVAQITAPVPAPGGHGWAARAGFQRGPIGRRLSVVRRLIGRGGRGRVDHEGLALGFHGDDAGHVRFAVRTPGGVKQGRCRRASDSLRRVVLLRDAGLSAAGRVHWAEAVHALGGGRFIVGGAGGEAQHPGTCVAPLGRAGVPKRDRFRERPGVVEAAGRGAPPAGPPRKGNDRAGPAVRGR